MTDKTSEEARWEQRFWNEQYEFGGELLTRAQVVEELKKCGGTPKEIDAYLSGMALIKEINERRDNK